ncbi:MAG: AMP-binding protein [Cycloclasticus sp.]
MKINFSDHFQSLCYQHGDREAIVNVERNRRYNFQQFHLLTNQVVNMMRDKLSLRDGDCFLNILDNDNMSLLHVTTIFKGDATGAFANYRDSIEEHRWQVECVKPKVVFVENSLLSSHTEMLKQQGALIVCMDPLDKPQAGVQYFWDLLDGVSDDNPGIEIDDREHVALIRFTGGTTGKGKPAMYCVDNWLSIRDSFYVQPDKVWNEQTRLLHLAPISHGSGLLWLAAFYAGGCNLTMNEPDLLRYCQTIEIEKVNSAMLVPTILYRLLELPEASSFDLASLHTMFYGAAPMSPAKLSLLQQKFGNIFIQIYGSTEHPAIALSLSKLDHRVETPEAKARLASAGRVTAGVELVIKDDGGKTLDVHEVGEIWVRSRGTIQGYLNSPEQTAAEITNGYWRSGDVGYKDEQGYVFLVDRKKDMIISGGFNVYATEVESAINGHSAVFMSAVVGVPHDEWGEAVHAEVMLREGQTLDQQELIDFVKEQLGSYKAPKTILLVDELPMSVVGKVLRRNVREKYWQDSGRRIG